MRPITMRRFAAAIVLVVVTSACAPIRSDQPTGITAPADATDSRVVVPDLETWCAGKTPDRCVEGIVYLDSTRPPGVRIQQC